jgi:hypothetical protein
MQRALRANKDMISDQALLMIESMWDILVPLFLQMCVIPTMNDTISIKIIISHIHPSSIHSFATVWAINMQFGPLSQNKLLRFSNNSMIARFKAWKSTLCQLKNSVYSANTASNAKSNRSKYWSESYIALAMINSWLRHHLQKRYVAKFWIKGGVCGNIAYSSRCVHGTEGIATIRVQCLCHQPIEVYQHHMDIVWSLSLTYAHGNKRSWATRPLFTVQHPRDPNVPNTTKYKCVLGLSM